MLMLTSAILGLAMPAMAEQLNSGDLCRAVQELCDRGYLKGGQLVAIVQSGREPIWRAASTHAIQVNNSPPFTVLV